MMPTHKTPPVWHMTRGISITGFKSCRMHIDGSRHAIVWIRSDGIAFSSKLGKKKC